VNYPIKNTTIVLLKTLSEQERGFQHLWQVSMRCIKTEKGNENTKPSQRISLGKRLHKSARQLWHKQSI